MCLLSLQLTLNPKFTHGCEKVFQQLYFRKAKYASGMNKTEKILVNLGQFEDDPPLPP